MATIKYGQIVAEARGKLAGTVFSRNSAGAYMRQKVTPVNTNTPYQQQVRSRLADISQLWRFLSANEQQAWNAMASVFTRTNIFGDNMPLTGNQLFIQINRNLQEIGAPTITTPPSPDAPSALTNIELNANTTGPTLELTFTPSPVPVGVAFAVYTTQQLSAGRNFVRSEYRLLTVLQPEAESPANLLNIYNTRFGALVAGMKIFVKLRPIDSTTGVPGPAVEASTRVE